MSRCSKCKKSLEEINLTWKRVDGKLLLLCDECNDTNTNRTRPNNAVGKHSK